MPPGTAPAFPDRWASRHVVRGGAILVGGLVLSAMAIFYGRHHGSGSLMWIGALLLIAAWIYTRTRAPERAGIMLSVIFISAIALALFHLISAFFALAGLTLPSWVTFGGAALQIFCCLEYVRGRG